MLIPEFPEGAPPALEQRFVDVRGPFFACMILSVAPAIPTLPAAPAPVWLLAAYAGLAFVGMLVSDRRWHIGLLWSMLVTFLTFLALARSSLAG